MPSKNIPVNGWPQIKELDIVAPILAELDKIEAWQKSVKQETKTGAEVTFTNALALPALSLSADIVPIQDLHGYDHPWVGGAGKNKYKMTTQTQTQDTVTVTANDDGTVNISRTGAATQNIVISLLGNQSEEIAPLIAAGGTYTLTSNKGAYDINTFNVTISYKNSASATTSNFMKIGDTVTFPVGAVLNASNLYVGSGKTVDAYDNFALQLESGSTPTSFAPYSNICPISGHSSVTITDVDAESQTATVTVQLGQTVYGGTVNLVTGAARITWVKYTLSSTGQTWSLSTTEQTIYANFPDLSAVETDRNQIKCSHFMTDLTHQAIGLDTNYAVYLSASKNLRVNYRPDDGNINIQTVKDYFDAQITAGIPVEVCGILATPLTLTLTPVAVEMLKGYNQISSDGGGDITVTAYTGNKWN